VYEDIEGMNVAGIIFLVSNCVAVTISKKFTNIPSNNWGVGNMSGRISNKE